jgi:superfamily II DNA or RNA helicase
MRNISLEELKLNIKRRYKNGPDNIGQDFVSPCLINSKLYRRGTGFFSSGALLAYAGAMEYLINGQIKIEIICSPVIQDKDLIQIFDNNLTLEQREKTLEKLSEDIVLKAIQFSENNADKNHKSALLAYMIASGILEIKFAVPYDINLVKEWNIQNTTDNLYHVKTGYFKLIDESVIAFDGSFNESNSGHQNHIEQTQVWRSWHQEDLVRMKDVIDDIDFDWLGKNKFLRTYELGSEAMELIKKVAPTENPIVKKNNPSLQESPSKLREYQKNALLAWSKNEHKGILALATGTGKTKTSIVAIKQFRQKYKNAFVIVTVPYIQLANQWVKELNYQNISTVSAFDSIENWLSTVQNLIQKHNLNNSTENIPLIVCVNKTFRSEVFQSLLKRLSGDGFERMIVVDECHHFNNNDAIKKLPLNINCRMGLSATPYEPNEPQLLDNYFKNIVYEYSIKEAISDDYLSEYEYHPIFVEFTIEEAEKYILTIKSMQKTVGNINLNTDEDDNNNFSMKEIDRLLESVAGKLSKLEKILKDTGVMPLTLFYCGEGFVDIDKVKTRQIDTLTRILFHLGWKVGKITSTESPNDRNTTLNNFKNKNIDAVASMRVLDEGIDVPDCTQAFILASQRLVRQGVQRRGRILRKSDNKKIAKLYDFIIIGPKLSDRELDKLYTRELQRAVMFSNDAINKNECMNLLNKV